MTPIELLRWQYQGYPEYHRSRVNLLLHIVVVPLFLVGNVALVAGLLSAAWWTALGGAVAMIVSVVAQGRGHAIEPTPPVPFSGPGQAVQRIFFEQWISFPRFVASGGWWRALRQAA